MGHIIDEIVFDFRVTLLPENDDNGKDECHQQHQRENNRRDHKPNRRENITVHIRKMNLHDPSLRYRIIAEKLLRIRILYPVVCIIRTTINLSSVLR